MKSTLNLLETFLKQAKVGDLKTASYPKQWNDLRLRISFGMGVPARIPWIAFIAPEMQVSKGFYPVYLYYKDLDTLILAYGVSETNEFSQAWPVEIMNSATSINAYFDQHVARYGDSYVFKAYDVSEENNQIKLTYFNTTNEASEQDIESDLLTLLDYYKKTASVETLSTTSMLGQGLFYMEKQLEDFIIHNWENTELGQKYELIVEEGELVSQQYRTEIGQIDILAKEKQSGDYVVIELKKNQTSDDTIGQLARYMGWIKEKFDNENVKGIIIAGQYDKKLDYALKIMQSIDVFIYEVDFKLMEFKGV